MKRYFFLLIISLFTVQIMASDLVLIPTKTFDESKAHFKNPALTVNFYRDEFIIATLNGKFKSDYVLLDKNPWQDSFTYYLVYVDETVDKEKYYQRINDIADVLLDGGNYLVLRIDETIHGQLPPAKNDGTVRISNNQVALPVQMFFNTSGRFDPDPFIVELLEEVTGENITATVQHLEDYGTRNCYEPESVEAQNWIREQFESWGLDVQIQDFPMSGGESSDNVIATLVGTKYPDEFIVIGGHYDSISYSGLEPGADDNASGTAGVMEVARVLSQYEFDRTIIFCAFSGEEYGLYGSGAYADSCAAAGMNIHGYLNMDMIGYLEPGSYIHTDLIYPQSAQELADYYTGVCATYLPDFVVEVGTLIGGDSDHTSFNNAGYMGIFPFEDGSDYSPYIHTSNDLVGPSYNNEEQAVQFTKAILATAVSMANRITPPQNLVAMPGDSEVQLQWGQMYDIDNYNVYRDGELVASPTDPEYLDGNVTNGTQYEYYVTAIYTSSGEESDPSNVVYATPMPPMGLPLTQDFENGAPYWDFEDTWGVSSQASHSPSHSITESPNGEYQNNQEIYAELTAFSLDGYTDASVSFWTKYNLESNYDYMWFEISTNGSSWTELEEFNGNQNSWTQKTYSLNSYLGEPYVKLRFHFYSDYYVTEEGMFIDDFEITAEGGMMTQGMDIPEGWSGFSSYIEPEETDIEDVLSSIEDEIVIVQNMGEVWWPAVGVNTIGMWDGHSGYKIKLSADATLQVAGYAEVDKTLELAAGWNLMPVLSDVPVSCTDLFGGVMDDVVIVKEVAGSGVFWPAEDIQTLTALMPAGAYVVKVDNPITISFEDLEAVPAKPADDSTREGWDLMPPTGNSHVISIPAGLLDIFEAGDQIGVFTSEEGCTGYVEIESFNDNLAMVVCGNDSTTGEHDGMMEGEVFNFKMYRSSTNLEYTLIAGFDASMPDQGNYAHEGLSKLELLQFDNTGITEFGQNIMVYPNPASEELHISGLNGKTVQLTICDINGQEVRTFDRFSGNYISLADLPGGVYFVRIQSDEINITRKLLIK